MVWEGQAYTFHNLLQLNDVFKKMNEKKRMEHVAKANEYIEKYHSKAIIFFQAEDGIRSRNVTGVQTCALPISGGGGVRGGTGVPVERGDGSRGGPVERGCGRSGRRSEERRVGKECRDRGSPKY